MEEIELMEALERLYNASYSLKESPWSNWCDYNPKSRYAKNGIIEDDIDLDFAIDEDYDIIKVALEEKEELKKKVKALDKALEILKQKRDNAQNDFKNLKCEKENVGKHIALKNQIDAYTDCIATIEAEMGRKYYG